MLTVARIDQNRIRVNVIPTRKREDENAALGAPLSFSGTPEEVDGEMARNLGVYVEDNLRLQHTLEEAKAEMDAAAKTARERASGKAGQTAKKTELQSRLQTDSTGTEARADQEKPPLLPACRHPCSHLSSEGTGVAGTLGRACKSTVSGCSTRNSVPLGIGSCARQNQTSICSLGLRRAFTED